MTTSFRHTLLVLAVACMAVACNDNSISSDALGTGGIGQGKIEYDSIPGMRAASGDTLDIIDAVQIGLDIPVGSTTSESYYVIGYVKEYYNPEKNPFDPNYGNICVTLTNRLQNRTFVCYRMKSFKGAMFTSQDQVEPGDIIVVKGQINNYNNAPQMPAGCQLVTSNNPKSGWTPAPKEIVKESFDAGMGVFAVVDKKTASQDVWTHIEATSDKQGYMSGTAYINKANEEAESWLVSPQMDLTGCSKGALLTFSHYGYYNTKDMNDDQISAAIEQRAQLLKVMVSTDGTNWTALDIDAVMFNQELNQKRFTQATIDLANYISAKTQIAFAYKSTSELALTWGIQNVRVGEPEEE